MAKNPSIKSQISAQTINQISINSNRQLNLKSYANHLKSIKTQISSQSSWQVFGEFFASFGEFLASFWRVLGEFMTSFGKFLARFFGKLLASYCKFLRVFGELLVSFGDILSSFCQVFGGFGEFWVRFWQVFGVFLVSLE